MQSARVSAVLFAKDLNAMAEFYSRALEMTCGVRDEQHAVLNCRGFDLIVHQVPSHLCEETAILQPPERRTYGAIRLSFPVRSIIEARRLARSWGGEIDEASPPWADANANVFLGHDPEGNVFKVSEHAG